MGRIFNDNGELNNDYQQDNSFQGGRIFGNRNPEPQQTGTEGIFSKFINYVEGAPAKTVSYFKNRGIGGMEEDVSNFGKSMTFGAGNLLSDVAGSLSYHLWGRKKIDEINQKKLEEQQKIAQMMRNPNIKKETRNKLFQLSQKLDNPTLADQIYDFAKKSKKQVIGESIGALTDILMGGAVDKAFSKAVEAKGVKPLAKYLASDKGAKYLTKSMIGGGLTMGVGTGASKMAEGGSNEEIRKSASTGAKVGAIMQPAIEVGGGYAGKLYKKLFKKGEASIERGSERGTAKTKEKSSVMTIKPSRETEIQKNIVISKNKNVELKKSKSKLEEDSDYKKVLNAEMKIAKRNDVFGKTNGKEQKAVGYQMSAIKRKIERKPTPIEKKKAKERLNKIHNGKKVRTIDGWGVATGETSFGRYKIKLENGKTKFFNRDDIIKNKKYSDKEVLDYLEKEGKKELKFKAEIYGIKPKKSKKSLNIKDIIKNDSSVSIKKEKSIINPENKKKANGKYQYNYKKKKGTIVLEEGAKNSTLAHEYAHHLNIKLGENGDKLSNNLANYLSKKGKKPKIFDGFNAKKIGEEIQKIGAKENQSENFATSVSKYFENPEKMQKVAPEFSNFIDEKVIPAKKGKNISWTKSEDTSVEGYIRSKGINKARGFVSPKERELSRKVQELMDNRKRLREIGNKNLLKSNLKAIRLAEKMMREERRKVNSKFRIEETPLHKEAKKYKNFDEFINAQNSFYHGTTNEIAQKIEKTGLKPNSSGYSWLAKNSEDAYGFNGRNVKLSGKIKTIDIWSKKMQKLQDKYGGIMSTEPIPKGILKQLKKDGYDGITDGGNLQLFNTNKLKSKSQLKKIWEEANKKNDFAKVDKINKKSKETLAKKWEESNPSKGGVKFNSEKYKRFFKEEIEKNENPVVAAKRATERYKESVSNKLTPKFRNYDDVDTKLSEIIRENELRTDSKRSKEMLEYGNRGKKITFGEAFDKINEFVGGLNKKLRRISVERKKELMDITHQLQDEISIPYKIRNEFIEKYADKDKNGNVLLYYGGDLPHPDDYNLWNATYNKKVAKSFGGKEVHKAIVPIDRAPIPITETGELEVVIPTKYFKRDNLKAKEKFAPRFRTEENVTLKTLDRIKEDIKKPVVSKQALLAYTNRGDIKQAERDIIRKVLDEMPEGKVNVKEFSDKVKSELLPLDTIKSEKGVTRFNPDKSLGAPRYKAIVLPGEERGNVADYYEKVYKSPIKTSAGNIHYGNGAGSPSSVKNYFAHSRIEDMADKNTRRVIEIQSDLFQKGNLEKSVGFDSNLKDEEWYKREAPYLLDSVKKTRKMQEKRKEIALKKLQPYRNTWHERIIKEEIKEAAKDGKTKLQFPTGETAMEIEGLGGGNMSAGNDAARGWHIYTNPKEPDILNLPELTPGRIKVGRKIVDIAEEKWVIIKNLGDGKFKAVPEEEYKMLQEVKREGMNVDVSATAEQFDVSDKLDTSSPIYKFYEKEVQKYLKKIHPEMKKIKDSKGVTWFEINPKKREGFSPVQAFRTAKNKIKKSIDKNLNEKQLKKITEFNKKLFGDENVKVTQQIMTPEGQKALGVYSDGMIKILKGQADPKDTYYHEVVHKYLDTMTTMEEHKEALIAAKRQFGVDTWKEAEEQLAESFIDYAKKREGVTGKLKAIFDKLLGRFKNYTDNKKAIKDFYGSIIEKKERQASIKEIVPKNLPEEFKPRKVDKTKFNEKLNTSESVHKLVTKLAKSDEIKKEIQRRGKVSWKETVKQANAMGIDLKGLRKEAKNAPDFAARIEAIKQIRANRASELHDYLSNIPRNPSEEQKAKIARKINEFLFVDRSLKSISAEHGRAINILKKEVEAQEFETYNKLIDDIIKIDPSKKDELSYVKEIDKKINPHTRLFTNILNFPRAMMATGDLSAPFRQGIFLINHPKIFGKSMKTMFKQALSEKQYQNALKKIESRESYPQMRKDGLAIMELGDKLSKREERIMSNLPEKIPIFGHIARASNRGYTGFLNNLRADTYDYFTKKAEEVGATKRNPEIGKDIANFVNTATGRGNIKSLEKYAEVLNGTFFSPRLIASRLNLLNPYYYYKLDPFVRKEALKSLFTLVGVGSTILALSKMGGADVKIDFRNADSAKIKIGDTRIDIWGGFQQYVVLASRLITNEMVSSTTGREFTLGEGYKPTTRGSILAKFFSYKTSPVASFALGLFNGQNVMGDKFKVPDEILRRSMPMLASDIYDLLGDKKSVGYAIPAAFGVGLQTYSKKIPFRGKTASGKRKIVWKEKPDLASAIVNKAFGNKESSIPKNRWASLWRQKVKKDTKRAEISNAKRRVLMTGKPERVHGQYIYIKNGIVKVRK